MKQGWEIKKLGEITEQINGLWIGKNPPFVTIAVIRNTNFTKDCNLDTNNIAYIQVEQKQYSTRKLKCGDIIIEKSGGSDKQPVGRPILFNIEDGEYSFSNFTSVLRVVDNTLISPKFLHKFLVYAYNQGYTLNMQSKTTGIRNLNFKLYKNMNVPVPERAEQERIVGELDCLSVIIAAKRAQLRELDTLAQSIFYTMFGDPITNDKGWQTKALGDVARIINGYAFDSKLFSTDKNDMPLIRIRDIKKGYTETFYKGKYPNTYIIKNGDYIIGMDGEFNIVEWRGGTALLNQRVCKIEFIDDEVIGRYALRFLSIELKRIEDATSFVTVKHLSSKSLISIFIPIPPIDLQKQFAEKIENIERQKELITKSIKETEDLFNSRMDYYFN